MMLLCYYYYGYLDRWNNDFDAKDMSPELNRKIAGDVLRSSRNSAHDRRPSVIMVTASRLHAICIRLSSGVTSDTGAPSRRHSSPPFRHVPALSPVAAAVSHLPAGHFFQLIQLISLKSREKTYHRNSYLVPGLSRLR